MTDIIRWVAESDPWIIGHALATCWYCKRKSDTGRMDDHAPGCIWVESRKIVEARDKGIREKYVDGRIKKNLRYDMETFSDVDDTEHTGDEDD